MKKKYITKLYKAMIAGLLSLSLCTTSLHLVYAKDTDESAEISDEDWNDIKDEMTDIEHDDEWDHKTWDEDHKELAWIAFGNTSWTHDVFPNLNFSKFGAYTIETTNLTDAEITTITDTVKGYKFYTGAYSIKNAEDHSVDNSAYVPLVLCCLDTLKAHGTADDPYAFTKYADKSARFTKEKYPDIYFQNIIKETLRRIISAEKIYNAMHPESLNIYQMSNDGVLIALQSVLYSSLYARTGYSYSSGTAEDFYESSIRKNSYSPYHSFAVEAATKYIPIESVGSYIMDGFGRRLEITE